MQSPGKHTKAHEGQKRRGPSSIPDVRPWVSRGQVGRRPRQGGHGPARGEGCGAQGAGTGTRGCPAERGCGAARRGALTRSVLPQACIRACQPDLSAETPGLPGNGEEQPLTENPRKYVTDHFRSDRIGGPNGGGGAGAGRKREEEVAAADAGAEPGPESGPDEHKRSHSMEHFRWGKPMGKKRRPVRVNPNGAENESAEAFPLEFKREQGGAWREPALSPERPAEGVAARAGLEYRLVAEAEDGGPYKMEHFRWGSPPKGKRYGGFMTSEKSQTPLVTLFRNAIIKNAHKKGQ